jgi:hypothetical protein
VKIQSVHVKEQKQTVVVVALIALRVNAYTCSYHVLCVVALAILFACSCCVQNTSIGQKHRSSMRSKACSAIIEYMQCTFKAYNNSSSSTCELCPVSLR